MATSNRNATVTLNYTVNQASIAQATAANNQFAASISQSLQSVSQQIAAMNLNTAQLAQVNAQLGTSFSANVTAPVNQASVSVKALIRDLGDLGNDIRDLPEPNLSSIVPGLSESGGSQVGNAIGNIRQAAIALPGVGFQSPLVVGLKGVEKLADSTGASLLELGAAGAIAGAALVAVKLAFDEFTKTIEDGKKLLTGALGAQQNYYTALATMTTKQVTDQVATLQRSRPLLEAQIGETQNALDSAFQQAQSQFGDVTARALDAAGKLPTAQLRTRLEDLQGQLQENIQTTARYEQGLKSGAFTVNDLRAAEEALTAAREKEYARQQEANKKGFDSIAQQNAQLAELRRSGTSDQVKAELAANIDRQAIIQNYLIPNYRLIGLSTTQLAAEFGNLTTVDDELRNSVLPVIKAREDEIAATKLQKEASDALNNTLQDINKTQVDLGKAADKTNEAYKALQQTTVDHNAKLADIQAQYQQSQQSALMKKNDQLLKIDQHAAERALEQRENDNFSILQAVARGDIASAQATLAQQRIRDTQAQRQVQQQKDDAQKAYDDQSKAAQQQNAKLLDSENDRYAKERQQRQDAYNQALQDQQALINRLASLRAQEAFQAAYYANTVSGAAAQASNGVAVLSNALTSLANSFISTAQRMTSQASGMSGGSSLGSLQGTRYPSGVHSQNPIGSAFVNDQLSLFYAAYNGTGGGGSRGFSASSYATGTDFVPQDMLAFIHRGERIIPASENNGMSGGVTVNVDARGSTIPQAQWEEWSERTATRTVQALTDRNNRVNRKGS
jgi:hypothetical protein